MQTQIQQQGAMRVAAFLPGAELFQVKAKSEVMTYLVISSHVSFWNNNSFEWMPSKVSAGFLRRGICAPGYSITKIS